jgi:hypothetical protein
MAIPGTPAARLYPSGQAQLLQRIKRDLLSVIDLYFNGQYLIQPEDFTILLGIYKKRKYPNYPTDDEARAKRLGIEIRYMLDVDRRAITPAPNGPPYHFRPGKSLVNASKNDIKRLYLDFILRRADLVWDDLEEMRRSGFIFAESVAELSPSTRAKNFSRKLTEVLVPEGVGTQSVRAFHDHAAVRSTYNDDLNYYAKYRKSFPTQPGDRAINFDKLSDDYLKLNFTEPELKRETVHLLLVLDDLRVLLELDADQGRLVPRLLFSPGFLGTAQVFQSIFDQLDRFQNREAIFFFTLDGSKTSPDIFPIKQPNLKLQVNPDEQVIEPKCMVKQLWEVECEAKDVGETKYWDDWQWFAEMVQLYFPSRVFEISMHGVRMLYQPDRNALFLNDLRQAASKAIGPIKDELSKLLERAEKDKNILILPQGLATGGSSSGGERILVGTDGLYIYLRNIETGLTSRVPTAQFVVGFRIGAISSAIYQRTRGIIPFAILVLTLGSLAIVGAVVGFGLLASGFRWFVRDIILNEGTKRLTKEAIHKALNTFYSQAKAMLIYGVALLFPKSDNPYFRFSLGFLHGYAIDSLTSLFTKYKDFVVRGPKYYRWYKLFKRIEASIWLLENKLEKLKARVDEAMAEQIAQRIVSMAQSAHAGVILLFNNLFFLEYDQVEGAILTLFQLADEKPPSKKDWERIRTERFKRMLQTFEDEVQTASAKIKVETDNIYDIMRYSLWGALAATELIHMSKYTAHFGQIALYGGLGGLLGLIGYDVVENEGQVSIEVLDLIARQFYKTDINSYKPEEVEKMGRIMGHVVGAFMVNGAIFRKDSRLGKIKHKKGSRSDKAISAFVSAEFGHGYVMPILKAVLFHYLILFERHKATGEKLWNDLLEELGVILLGDQAYLERFQTEVEKKITYAKIKLLFIRLDEILTARLKELAATPNLAEKLRSMAEHLESARLPSFDDILDGKQPEYWSRESMLFVMVSHLHMALLQFAKVISMIEQPIAPDRNDPLTLLEFLEIIGIEIDEEKAAQVLGDDLQELFQPKQSATP